MGTIEQYTDNFVAKWNGRKVSLDGEDINADGRYGIQCMDLWLKFRYGLGFKDWLATPDAASVWELNNQPGLRMWQFFDSILPSQPAKKGDIGIMNRNFFGNGVGHIFVVLADLGSSIRVLETNGLGDGYEDEYMNQYGSAARIHDWPKTYLYGYLRWIGPVPDVNNVNSVVPAGGDVHQLEEDVALTKEEIDAIAKRSAELTWLYDFKRPDGSINKPLWILQSLDAIIKDAVAKTAKATADTILNTKVYDVRTGGTTTLANSIAWQGKDTATILDALGKAANNGDLPAELADQVKAAIDEKVSGLQITLSVPQQTQQ